MEDHNANKSVVEDFYVEGTLTAYLEIMWQNANVNQDSMLMEKFAERLNVRKMKIAVTTKDAKTICVKLSVSWDPLVEKMLYALPQIMSKFVNVNQVSLVIQLLDVNLLTFVKIHLVDQVLSAKTVEDLIGVVVQKVLSANLTPLDVKMLLNVKLMMTAQKLQNVFKKMVFQNVEMSAKALSVVLMQNVRVKIMQHSVFAGMVMMEIQKIGSMDANQNLLHVRQILNVQQIPIVMA